MAARVLSLFVHGLVRLTVEIFRCSLVRTPLRLTYHKHSLGFPLLRLNLCQA